jgi:hypothetical protein
MSAKENIYAALVVTVMGLIVYLLISSQVSMEPVPGSMGYSRVGPSTLPRTAAWGFILTGLVWLALETRRLVKARRARRASAEPIQETADPIQRDGWGWSMLVWVGMLTYIALTPVLGFAESCAVFGLPLGIAIARSRPKGLQKYDLIGLLIGVVLAPLLLHFLFYRFLYVAFPVGPISRMLTGG